MATTGIRDEFDIPSSIERDASSTTCEQFRVVKQHVVSGGENVTPFRRRHSSRGTCNRSVRDGAVRREDQIVAGGEPKKTFLSWWQGPTKHRPCTWVYTRCQTERRTEIDREIGSRGRSKLDIGCPTARKSL